MIVVNYLQTVLTQQSLYGSLNFRMIIVDAVNKIILSQTPIVAVICINVIQRILLHNNRHLVKGGYSIFKQTACNSFLVCWTLKVLYTAWQHSLIYILMAGVHTNSHTQKEQL